MTDRIVVANMWCSECHGEAKVARVGRYWLCAECLRSFLGAITGDVSAKVFDIRPQSDGGRMLGV